MLSLFNKFQNYLVFWIEFKFLKIGTLFLFLIFQLAFLRIN
jgi:hypothetical protein